MKKQTNSQVFHQAISSFAFIRGFHGLKGLPNCFFYKTKNKCQTLIEQGFALVYIDDILLLSNSKLNLVQLFELHQTVQKIFSN